MEITARDLARYLELNKKKAELEFGKTVLGSESDKEIALVSSNALELAFRMKAAGVGIVSPNTKKLDELAAALAKFTPDMIREGMKIRDGLAYQTLKERGVIVKSNFENRLEIAKISILLSKMIEGERAALREAIESGSVPAPLRAASLEDRDRKALARSLCRCGISCAAEGEELRPSDAAAEQEMRVQMQNRTVWVSETAKSRLEENLKKINSLNAHIQLKNAVRQIKIFDAQEEKLFASLQQEYLTLLKEQDELLKDFNEEERLAIKAGQ